MGKATGPRTLKGKARASENAAKHRIESGRILPSEQKDAEVLRDGLTECFNPVGLAENEVVDDILINRLTRRRIDLAFTQEYSKASAVKQQTWLDNHERTAIRLFVGSSFSRGRRRGEKDARLRPDLCIHGLEVLRSQIKDRGPQPKRDLQTLLRIFGDEPTECAALVTNELAHIAVDDVTDASDQEELKKSILETIGKEVALQKHRLELTRELDDIAFASDIQEPDAPTRETLLRYRAANTREFKDLVGALELIRLFGSGIRGNSMDLLRLPTMANLMMKTESQDSAVHRGSSGSESILPFATFIKNEPGERPSNANSRTRS